MRNPGSPAPDTDYGSPQLGGGSEEVERRGACRRGVARILPLAGKLRRTVVNIVVYSSRL